MISLDKKAIAYILSKRIISNGQTICPIAIWEDDGGRPSTPPSKTLH